MVKISTKNYFNLLLNRNLLTLNKINQQKSLRASSLEFFRAVVFFILGSVFITITQSSSAAPTAPTGEPRWDGFEEKAAFSLENRRGQNQIHQIAPKNPNHEITGGRLESEGGVGNGNYHLEIPLIRLPGRGQDLNLTLYYNSQILNIDKNNVVGFDADGSWPAPGANIGFGKLIFPNDNASAKNSMLILPNGSRRSLKQAKTSTGGLVSAEFIDGSGERVECSVDSDRCRKSEHHATAYLADGSTMKFITSKPRTSVVGTNLYYPHRLVDAHLNVIKVNYRRDNGVETPPHIDSIEDTVGRIFKFHYDVEGLLIAITGPDENWNEITYVRFYYRYFDETIEVPHSTVGKQIDFFALTAIFFPSDKTGYLFDEFTPFGIPNTVSANREMEAYGGSLTKQGGLTAGRVTRKSTFNYSNDKQYIRINNKLPTYTTKLDYWDDLLGVDGFPNPTTTKYEVRDNGAAIDTIYPDGSKITQAVITDRDNFAYGLAEAIHRFGSDFKKLSTTRYIWEETPDGIIRQKEVQFHNHEINAVKRTEFEYGQNSRQITKEIEYGYVPPDQLFPEFGPRVEKRIVFLNDDRYKARNLNLPVSINIYTHPHYPETHRVKSTLFNYDEYEPEFFYFPSIGREPCSDTWCKEGNPTPIKPRGNLTSVINVIDIRETDQPASNIKTNYYYDNLGNLIEISPDISDFNGAAKFKYDSSTQYSLPSSIIIGDRNNSTNSATTHYQYNLSIGLPTMIMNPDGKSTKYSYKLSNGGRWNIKQMTTPTGVTTTYDFNHANLRQENITTDGEGNKYSNSSSYSGRGLLMREEKFLPETNENEVTEFRYDYMGRMVKRMRPTNVPNINSWVYYDYDSAGRLSKYMWPTGKIINQWFYNESSRPNIVPKDEVGETVRIQDSSLRERWIMYDAKNRPYIVVEPNEATGKVLDPASTLTKYGYHYAELDYILRWLRPPVVSTKDDLPMPELRWFFRYDGLGRLVCADFPEQDDHVIPSNGFPCDGWNSHYYTYDKLSNLILHRDARGVETRYNYNLDPLNRLQSIKYDLQNVITPAPVVLPVSDVKFTYATAGDPRRITSINTLDVSHEKLDYDEYGRLKIRSFEFNKAPGSKFVTEFVYDSLNRRQLMKYPARYENGQVMGFNALNYYYSKDQYLNRIDLDGNTLINISRYSKGSSLGFGSFIKFFNKNKSIIDEENWQDFNYRQNYRQETFDLIIDPTYPQSMQARKFSYNDNPSSRDDQITKYWLNNMPSPFENEKSFLYDTLGRLALQIRDSTNERWEYAYDKSGNRYMSVKCVNNTCNTEESNKNLPAKLLDSGDITNLFFNPKTNQINSPGHTYDRAGNLTRGLGPDGAWQLYIYDAAGRLSQVLNDNGTLIEAYFYGADRRRIGVSNNLKDWRLAIWDGNLEIAHYDKPVSEGLTWVDLPVYLGNRLLTKIYKPQNSSNFRLRYFHPDNLGTTLVTEHIGEFIKRYYKETSPFGSFITITKPYSQNLSLESTEDENRFTSYSRSEKTGLDYAVNRYYDPKLGRFLEPDPLGIGAFDLSDPQSLNPYVYARNDPINRIDPLGLIDCDQYGSKDLRSCPKYIPEMIADVHEVWGERKPKNDPSMNPANIPWYHPQVNTRNHGESEPKSKKSKNKSTNAECENLYQRNLSILENQKQEVKDASLRQLLKLFALAGGTEGTQSLLPPLLSHHEIDNTSFGNKIMTWSGIITGHVVSAAAEIAILAAATFASPGEIAAFNYSADNIETVLRNSRNPNPCPRR